jgi:hypothetical protein
MNKNVVRVTITNIVGRFLDWLSCTSQSSSTTADDVGAKDDYQTRVCEWSVGNKGQG